MSESESNPAPTDKESSTSTTEAATTTDDELAANASLVTITEEEKQDEELKTEDADAEQKEETEGDEEDEEESSRKLESIEALNEAHSSLKSNLEQANKELSEQTSHVQELEEKISSQKERIWLMEEKIRSLTERECLLLRNVEGKESRLENVQKELSEAKWKLEGAEQFLSTLENEQAELQERQDEYEPKILEVEGRDGESGDGELTVKQLSEDVQRLQSFKSRLDEGDPELVAIQSGAKILELEESKREMQEAFNERALRIEAMYLEVDELNERIEQKTKSIDEMKVQCWVKMDGDNEKPWKTQKDHEAQIWQLKNQLQCLGDTERRLQRSMDYVNAKIDYGMDVPAPVPWSESDDAEM